MRLYLRLAWRNLWRHRRRTVIVVTAMALGLSLMMVYDGFVGGFNQAIYGNAIKVLGGNIQVHAVGFREKADQSPLLPLANDQAVITSALAHLVMCGAPGHRDAVADGHSHRIRQTFTDNQ